MNTREMRQKRAGLVKEARGILDLAEKEGRDLTGEETEGYESRMSEIDRLRDVIEREENLSTLEVDISRSIEEPVKPEVEPEESRGIERRDAYNRYLRVGESRMSGDEVRALEVGTDSEGGLAVKEYAHLINLAICGKPLKPLVLSR
jgi:HK97 family phage major capsid protein